MTLRWTTPARDDLRGILDYIARDKPAAAMETIDRIESAALRLPGFPLLGREGSVHGTRELHIPGLPFILIYRARKNCIEPLRVLHEARRWPPG